MSRLREEIGEPPGIAAGRPADKAAVARGLDPDRPRALDKITRTW
jgi:hypothetical protein